MKTLWLIAGLALAGCSAIEARDQAVETVRYVVQEADEYVRERDEDREWVRAQCRDMLRFRVQQLREDGDYEAATALLKANYPPLVTMEVYRQWQADPSSAFSELFGCN